MYPGSNLGNRMNFFLFFSFYVFFCHNYYSANLQIQHYCMSLLRFSYFITPYDAQASSAFSALIFILNVDILSRLKGAVTPCRISHSLTLNPGLS